MHAAMTTVTIVFDIFGGAENIVNCNASERKNELLKITLKVC